MASYEDVEKIKNDIRDKIVHKLAKDTHDPEQQEKFQLLLRGKSWI